MRSFSCRFRAVVVLALLLSLASATARAQSLRVVATDERGVTLRLSLPDWRLGALRPDPLSGGAPRAEIVVPGFAVTGVPGRALVPFAQALIALPPGAGAAARIVEDSGEEVREDMRLAICGQPAMQDRNDGFGPTPSREPVPPILDGPWPVSPLAVGEPFTLRRQRMVAIQVWPFRYDEATSRLWVRRTLTVRVDFTGLPAGGAVSGAPATDRHWEPVFQSALANYEQGRQWREPAGPAGGRLFDRAALPAAVRGVAAFDENDPEVRIRVDTTGVYAFTYDDLAAQGYPAGVPIGEVSLHRHEYVGPVDPPYVTIELPIEVDDWNANGVFDSGDWIVAFVQNWVERSGVTSYMQRNWGDAEMVYATRLAGGAGSRMATRPGWRDATGLTPLASYPWTQRWERSFTYFPFPSPLDTATVDRVLWTESSITYYNRPDSLRFETNHLDTTHTVVFRTILQGMNSNPHVMYAQVKNGAGQFTTVLDSLTWYGKDRQSVAATLTGSAFSEGRTNTMRLWGKGTTASPTPEVLAGVSLDAFEATYWRAYRALGGYLAATSAAAAGPFQVHATGFTSAAIRLYDVTDGVSPVRLALDPSHITPVGGGEYALDFQDSTVAPVVRRYVVFDTPKFLPPERYAAVTRRHLTGAVGEQDYVLIVPEAFLPAMAPLAALRRAQGLGVVVAPLESVSDEFNGGRKSAFAIKRFLRWAYESWNTRFVTLVGDGSCDGRNVLPWAGTDWMPVQLVPAPVGAGTLGLELVPSDPWYGWCVKDEATCTRADSLREPEIYVGRLPVGSLQQASDVVAKLVAYEAFDSTETWRRRMLLLADDCYSGTSFFGGGGAGSGYCYRYWEEVFRQLNEATAEIISDPSRAGMSLAQPEVLDLRYWLTEPSLYQVNGPGDTCRVGNPSPMSRAEAILSANFKPALFQRLNAGVLWWNYQGHANQTVLAHEGFYHSLGTNQDYVNFLNDDKPFLFSAFSCHANAFAGEREARPDNGPSLGENMVTVPRRGAIASWASTGFEVVPSSGTYHLNTELARALFQSPPHDDERGRGVADRGARVVLGEAIAVALLRYLPSVRQWPYEREVGLTYNLLGDPATRLWVGPAQVTVTANGVPVTNGQPVRLTTSGDTLRLEAELVSNVEITSIELVQSRRGGTTVVPPSLYTLTPSFPDTGIGGAGGRRYHLSYFTTLASSSLRYQLRVTDRYGVTQLFEVVFEFRTELFAGDVPLHDNDLVAADAALALLVLSPGKLDPDSLDLEVDGQPQAFVAEAARGDTTGRQFWLRWQHAPYAEGGHRVLLEEATAENPEHRFQVVSRFALRDVFAFPNPFDDELGTRFVFTLTGDAGADVLVRVFTASGRRVYETRLGGLPPGHHEIPWDGLDEEGQKLANGIYFYKVVAHGSAGTSSYDGRLVKLRRPKRSQEPAPGTGAH